MDTLKIHSVRSTGIPGVIEEQELSCMCDVCMEGGERCQNTHLVLGWSRVDLFSRSGEDFMNTHWPKVHNTRKECDTRSKRRRNKLNTAVNVNTSLWNRRKPQGKPNQDVTKEVKRRNTCHKKGKKKETTWIDVANDLEKSNSYQDLERRVQNVTLEPSIQMGKTSFPLGQNTVHDLTKELYPTYLPKGYDPINAYGDGNCFPRSISLIGYGDQTHFKEIRAMLAVLGVRYKEFFLDNTFLNLGSNFDIDLAEYYAITSESYTIHARSGEWSREKIEIIYEIEVLNSTRRGNYCGMWQVYQAANILGRPIMSIFPHPGMIEEFRRRTNRMVYPIRIYKREREPVAVMWSKSRKDVHHEDHFVPIFKM